MCFGFNGEAALAQSLGAPRLSRRSALRTAGALGAGLLAAGATAPAAHATPRPAGRHLVPPGQISIQLWTMRDALEGEPGFDETLRTLAEIGYPKVEQALGYFGRTAGELRSFYDSIGLSATSSHDGVSDDEEALQTKIDNARTLGQSFLVVPYLDSPNRDDWKRWAEQMNHEAEVARSAGLRYGYHNHAHEFTTDLGGVTPWQVLTAELDPALVHLELDLYWAVRGGIESGQGADDPEGFAIDVIRTAPQAVLQYHVKDRHPEDGDMADLGTGHIDFARIFRAHAVLEYVVENDTPDVTPEQTADVGYRYLRALKT
ncbi:sugar phosphate isomerase/epimerase [Saccharopolyspora rhizosphaerae]|uniref:Sugar phosphate isomerase/epimerase n=1 Tax=Saccharopolyspora rhizosphaerae TaxID=2492662 RepID=A0A3R8R2Y1_9PSEU|nr:sugar phosphate isomerase/epimerase [Saccharopolyspora rhizosphaerae]RRO17025.1 sugar phosphate isomerase/epimerase [Saccharopolyspora rhizosphaerae]